MPSSHQLCPDRFKCCAHPLFHGQADDFESPLPVRATTVCKPKEVERFGLALSPTFAIGCSESTKLDQPRLLRVQGQPKLGQSLLHVCQEMPCFVLILESKHTVVCV